MKFKKYVFAAVLSIMIASVYSQTAMEIAKACYDLPEGKTHSNTAVMTLTNKKGQVRIREITSKSKDYGNVKKSLIIFTTPKDVTGVGYLNFDYPDNADGTAKDSDSWLYMPAMKKVRRISGSNTEDDFMGSDFTYDDIGKRSLAKDVISLLGEENINETACWKLEYKSKNQNAKISRRVLWIGKSNYVVYKGEFYDRQNSLSKILSIEDIRQIKGYWTICKMTMENVQTSHKTVLELKDIVYDERVDDNMFSVAALERGVAK